jgi:hypothetical protein
MHPPAEFDIDLFQLGMPLLPYRLAEYRKHSVSRLTADMGEAKKVERLGFPIATPLAIAGRKTAKFDQARLVRVEP